jgi:hypothetical protein
MRVVFLIVSSSDQPYARIQHQGQEKTWIKTISNYENVDFRYLISDGSKSLRNSELSELHKTSNSAIFRPATRNSISSTQSNTLIINSSRGWESILSNTLTGFKWALEVEEKFDFVIRTNISSYWNIQNTLELLSSLPETELYAGHELNVLETRFIAGDGIILSRDLVELISSRVSEIDSGVIDDVALGRFLRNFEITPKHIPRPIVQTLFDCHNFHIYKNKTHQVRCKVERKLLGKSYRLDVSLMKSLHRNFRRHKNLS